ncbi:MAG TPA: CheR family methyltransferase [Candidatus Saccharimonadales bacterium]|nr:CheR family methyltransferase [Candidatus Saccharimonadales bacterium]
MTETNWSRLSELIADRMGLHFPPERWSDLQRGLTGAAEEFGFADVRLCVDWLLSAPLTKAQFQALASHLTIGETYFFREKRTFEVLADSALPELIRLRRGNGRRLRLWSAACCTGEEAYSLAILLHQVIPDLEDWHVTILATDINERFLRKAAAGVYGEWSFRESPSWFRERYFQRTGKGQYEIAPEIKKLVTFAHMNLVEDCYPTLETDTNAMDVIFCRNVLMYFAPSQAATAVCHLRRALVDDGWLAVSPCEVSQTLFSRFAPANFPGATLYQKTNAKVPTAPSWTLPLWSEPSAVVAPALDMPAWAMSPAVAEEPAPPDVPATPLAAATSLYQQGRYAQAAETLRNSISTRDAPNPQAFSLLARALANQGELADASHWCDRWVAADKLDASGHYLRAVVLQELGDQEQSRRSLQRAIYLRPDMALAHFALGNLARAGRRNDEADKHFTNAARLLRSCQPDDVLPESDGLTAGRLIEIISSITALGTTP